ncbi:bile acid:sodium symporter family protein [Microvenator marinus]|uniref:Bile acid:sodium symporter family protein n=1 Tax=Microvenator marinus TaxID=2600177 RepID=A0A5B8XP04_9DELT|nr:bile acid:sodium symporter family protein [Microvenator marinus]QED27622.1 bile acid:sodium symporter family protein [Microvenator marinus]
MIDEVVLNFNPASLIVLNVILAVVMFGVALDLRVDDFKRVISEPKSVALGLLSQLVLLPALTWGLVLVIEPQPSVALGMILVAACPGGNMSNFFTHFARGNTGLSISMTTLVTSVAVFTTPFNFGFWAGLYPPTARLLREVELNVLELGLVLFLLLALPLALGMTLRHKKPELADRIVPYFRHGSLGVFALFIVLALLANWEFFKRFIGMIFVLVFVHNAVALLTGFIVARVGKLSSEDRRALTIETGIQNSGLALVLIFTFFQGLGGMAIIAAWWGVWHLIAGLSLSGYWRRVHPERVN